MSRVLDVKAEQTRTCGQKPEYVIAQIIQSCRESALPKFRLIHREVPLGIELAAFDGSAAFAALLERPNRRDSVKQAMRMIASQLFLAFKTVIIRRYDAHDEPGAAIEAVEIEIALDAMFSVTGTWRLRGPLLRFALDSVEAKLFTPSVSPDGRRVTGYFCSMEVNAVDEQALAELVSQTLVGDFAALVNWQSCRIIGLAAGGSPRATRVGGRIFF